MTLQELKQGLFELADQYIKNAEAFQKSSFAFTRLFSNPHRNLESARNLKALCQEKHNTNAFIIALNNIFTNQEHSTYFIPQIAILISSCGLYPKAQEMHQAIQNNIIYAKNHNDGGGAASWEISHFLAILKAELPTPHVIKPAPGEDNL